MGLRTRAAVTGAAVGLLAIGVLAWATLAGWTRFGFRGDVIAMGAAMPALTLLFVTKRQPFVVAAVSFLAAMTLMLPVSVFVYEHAVADAKAYCAAGAKGDPPALAQPDFSERYKFTLSDGVCRFPDPVGPRVHWTGEVHAGKWTWEKLMD